MSAGRIACASTALSPVARKSVVLFLAAGALLLMKTPGGLSRSDDKDAANRARLQQAKQIWEKWIQENVAVGDELKKVHDLLKSSSRDRGEIALGGTGHRRIYYMLDDYHQLEFVVDKRERLTTSIAVTPARTWIKLPAGNLLSGEGKLRQE